MKQDTFFVIILVLLLSVVIYLLKTNKNRNRTHTIYKQHKPSKFLEKAKEVFTNVADNLSSNIQVDDKGNILSVKSNEEKRLQQKAFDTKRHFSSYVKNYCEVEAGIKPEKVLKEKTLDDKISMFTKCYHLLVDDLYFDIYRNKDTKDPLTKKHFDMRQDKKDELEQDFQALIKKIRDFEEDNKIKLQKKDCPCDEEEAEAEEENNTVVASNETDNNYEKNLEEYMRLVRLKNIAKTY